MRRTLARDPVTGTPHQTAWSRTFPATPSQIREARHFLTGILTGHPATENAVACLSELATNAIQHSRSRHPGGTFTIRMRRSGPALRIEVEDNGGPWITRPQHPEHGRGLKIVRELSDRQGITTTGPRHDPIRRTIWYEISPA